MKKKPEPKLNVRLLRRVQKAILAHADQFLMEQWSSPVDSQGNEAGGCGTAACIAGWMENWPNKFEAAYEKAKTAKQAAEVAAKRIEHFISTGE